MGLLEDDRPTNPATHFLKLKNGAISFYDKESGENIDVATPFKFVVLDQMGTIKGWSDQDDSSFWSNEVRRIGSDTVNVRTKEGLKATGVWKDIKSKPSVAGAKYNSMVYIAANGKNGLEIMGIALTASSLKAWIEFTKANNIKKNSVTITEFKDAKKGAVNYKVPVFKATPMTDAERDGAIEQAKILKAFHDEYFSFTPAPKKAAQSDDVLDLDVTDEPINLDDIPF